MDKRKIHILEDRFGHADHRRISAKNPSSLGDLTLPSGEIAVGPAVVARVNQGRWIADCPELTCGGAELVSFDNPLFFCCECRNEAVDHALLPVVLPPAAKRRDIEAYLRARPDPTTRNWWPGETVAALRSENRARRINLLTEE